MVGPTASGCRAPSRSTPRRSGPRARADPARRRLQAMHDPRQGARRSDRPAGLRPTRAGVRLAHRWHVQRQPEGRERRRIGPAARRGRDPGTPADDANVELVSTVTDVRRKGDLSDYAGELQAVVPLRITDSNNGAAANERATGDTTFTFPIPCLPTGDSGVGSTCRSRPRPMRSHPAPCPRARAPTGRSARCRCSTEARTTSRPPRETPCSCHRESSPRKRCASAARGPARSGGPNIRAHGWAGRRRLGCAPGAWPCPVRGRRRATAPPRTGRETDRSRCRS